MMPRKIYQGLSGEEKQQLKKEIFRQLDLEEAEPPVIRPLWKRSLVYAAAASVMAVISLLLMYQNNLRQPPQTRFVAKTDAYETRELRLPDGSTVILNPLSTLEYRINPNTRAREVVLSGNGFFKVKKDEQFPHFLVHAHSITVSVVGTQFNVNARTPLVEVALTSGKVQVNWNSGNAGIARMVPGDLLRSDQDNHQFITSKVDTLMYSAWTRGQWTFRNTTLENMAKLIQEYYGVTVSFDNNKNKYLKMTGVLPVNGLHDLVKVISETLQVPIRETNNHLSIP